MDRHSFTKPDGRVVEVSESEIGRALLDGKSVLIASPRKDWATTIFNAWVDEITDNPPQDIDFTPHVDLMHISFTNGALLQVVIIDDDFDKVAFAGRTFDVFKPVMFQTVVERRRAEEIRAIVKATLK